MPKKALSSCKRRCATWRITTLSLSNRSSRKRRSNSKVIKSATQRHLKKFTSWRKSSRPRSSREKMRRSNSNNSLKRNRRNVWNSSRWAIWISYMPCMRRSRRLKSASKHLKRKGRVYELRLKLQWGRVEKRSLIKFKTSSKFKMNLFTGHG